MQAHRGFESHSLRQFPPDSGTYRIETTLDEFVALATQLRQDLMIEHDNIEPLDSNDPYLQDDN